MMKRELVAEVLKKLSDAKWLSTEKDKLQVSQLVDDALYGDPALLDEARIANIIEFAPYRPC